MTSLSDAYGSEDTPKGEIVVLIGPPVAASCDAEDEIALDSLLTRHLDTMSIKDAASVVAEETGLPRRRVYARAIALSRIKDG